MNEGIEQPHEPENDADTAPMIKRLALPASVIFMSWFCGIIACGVTCSFVQSPTHMMLHNESEGIRFLAWACWIFAIVLGVYAGLHVGKDVRKRYRVDRLRKEKDE